MVVNPRSEHCIELESPYWRERLEGRKYDAILFRDGYATGAPQMLIKFRSLRRYSNGRSAYYAIRFAKI